MILAFVLLGCEFSTKTDEKSNRFEATEVAEIPEVEGRRNTLEPLEVNGQTFYVEVADTQAEREQGLMYRESMKADEGMLFVFQENDQHNFWMKNTLIPLDMVWISEDKKVVDVQAAEPCTQMPCTIYKPAGKSSYVLEVLQGMFPGEIGDTIIFE